MFSLLRLVVTNPCFIHCHILHGKNSFLIRLNSARQTSKPSTNYCHREQTRPALRREFSHEQVFVQNSKYTAALISLHCQLSYAPSVSQSSKTISFPFLMCFRMIAAFGQRVQHNRCLYDRV